MDTCTDNCSETQALADMRGEILADSSSIRQRVVDGDIDHAGAIALAIKSAVHAPGANPFVQGQAFVDWIVAREDATAATGQSHVSAYVVRGFLAQMDVESLAELLGSPTCEQWLAGERAKRDGPTIVEQMAATRFGSWSAFVDRIATGQHAEVVEGLLTGATVDDDRFAVRVAWVAYQSFRAWVLAPRDAPDLGAPITPRFGSAEARIATAEANIRDYHARSLITAPKVPLLVDLFDVARHDDDDYAVERKKLHGRGKRSTTTSTPRHDLGIARRKTEHGVVVSYAAAVDTGTPDADVLGTVCRHARDIYSYGYSGDFAVAIVALLWLRIQERAKEWSIQDAAAHSYAITWTDIDDLVGFTRRERGLSPRAIKDIRERLTVFVAAVGMTRLSMRHAGEDLSSPIFTCPLLATEAHPDGVEVPELASGQFKSGTFMIGPVVADPIFTNPAYSLLCYADVFRAADMPANHGTERRLQAQWLVTRFHNAANDAVLRADGSNRPDADYAGADWHRHPGVPVVRFSFAEVEATTGLRLVAEEVPATIPPGPERNRISKRLWDTTTAAHRALDTILSRLYRAGTLRSPAIVDHDAGVVHLRPSDAIVAEHRARAHRSR